MIGLILLWVGAVLFLNGLWLLEYIADREIAIINIFSGGILFLASTIPALRSDADIGLIRAGAFGLLFAFTYLWVAVNRFLNPDGRGLGWYSLFVAITAVPFGIELLMDADTSWEYWFGFDWLAWAVLWFVYYLLLVPRRVGPKFAGGLTLIEGILTAWLPGYLILTERLAI